MTIPEAWAAGAAYIRLPVLHETHILVVDSEGHTAEFETASMFEMFQLGLESQHLGLFDAVAGSWLVDP